jgi:ribonucleoside-diphosphate reductase alpha chain
MQVTKRNGNLEEFNLDKIHRMLTWAVEDVANVNVSDIEMNAQLNLYDGIPTTEIHQVLIKSAGQLISQDTPNYQYVAARLLLYHLRKQVWGDWEPPRFYDHIKNLVSRGIYDKDILDKYTESEIHKLGKYIKHTRDEKFTYSGLQQMVDKYLVKNRKTNEIYETPQFAYMLVPMTLFADYPEETRFDYIKQAYDFISQFKINLPTPILAGVRTPIRQYSSCILIDVGDSLPSIASSNTAVFYYTARRAGIGLNVGRIRPIGSEIRGGEVIHTGLIPYLRTFQAACKSTTQNGIRGGSATVNVPFWHFEIEDVIVLKNNAGTDDNRVRQLDYCIQFSKLFYERVVKDEYITLFSPHECQELYDAFGHPEFDALYEEYESKRKLSFKKKIKARDLIEQFTTERKETARIYIMNIDHVNQHGAWKDDVKMTNLCCVTGDTKVDALINGLPCKVTITELIECLNETDKVYVLSKNIDKDTVEYQLVTAGQLTRENAEIIEITDESTGKILRCTPDHRIYTKNRGYVRADELIETDELDII